MKNLFLNLLLAVLLVATVIGIYAASLTFVSKNYNDTDADPDGKIWCYIKSDKYHSYDCPSIKGKKSRCVYLINAIQDGYKPCSKCTFTSNDDTLVKNAQYVALLPSIAAIVAFVCIFKYGNKS